MCLSAIARIVAVDESDASALVDEQGTMRRISLAVLALDGTTCRTGDWVVVHTGLAVARIDPDEAASVIAARAGLVAATTEGESRP